MELRLGGHLLVVEGKHHDLTGTRLVHHAVAMISWDAARQGYRIQSHMANGLSGEFKGTWQDGALVWELPTPGGTMRYTIRIQGDAWHEVGELNRCGTWTKVMEMTLKRER